MMGICREVYLKIYNGTVDSVYSRYLYADSNERRSLASDKSEKLPYNFVHDSKIYKFITFPYGYPILFEE